MARYFIEDVKCDIGPGGFACGPVDGPVVAEAKIKTDSGEEFFLCLAEVMGIPNFFKTDRSTYDEQLDLDISKESIEYAEEHSLGIEYEDIYADPDMEDRELLRYITYIVRSSWEECRPFMKATKGKWLDEIEIPVSEYERELLDEEDEE